MAIALLKTTHVSSVPDSDLNLSAWLRKHNMKEPQKTLTAATSSPTSPHKSYWSAWFLISEARTHTSTSWVLS